MSSTEEHGNGDGEHHQLAFISISETDADGNAIDRDKFEPGDVIRIISIDGETSDLKIESGGTGFYKIESATGSLVFLRSPTTLSCSPASIPLG